MSAAAGRVAGKVGQAASKAAAKTAETGGKPGGESALKKGARRDPELYVSCAHGSGFRAPVDMEDRFYSLS